MESVLRYEVVVAQCFLRVILLLRFSSGPACLGHEVPMHFSQEGTYCQFMCTAYLHLA